MSEIPSMSITVGAADGPQRDLSAARDAYQIEDDAARSAASMVAHSSKKAAHSPEAHKSGGEYIKSIIFGGLDGILQTFAVVSSIFGGGLSPFLVLVLGFATNIADALSMGFGDYLGTKAEVDFAKEERKREMWECDNYIEGEKQEMVDLYISRGLAPEDAQRLVDILSKDPKTFVDIMMVEELGLMPDAENASPAKNGLITFISFIIFGCVPLFAYIVTELIVTDTHSVTPFIISCAFTLFMLFVLGCVKGRMTSVPMIKTGLQMILNGVIASSVAYLIGYTVKAISGVSNV